MQRRSSEISGDLVPKLCPPVNLNHEPGTCPRFMSHVQFLEAEWPEVFESASKAEALTRSFNHRRSTHILFLCFGIGELKNCLTGRIKGKSIKTGRKTSSPFF